LGEARSVNGDLDGARQAYRRALELSPSYEFAGNGLFDLQLEDGDLHSAAATLATLRAHVDTPLVAAREVQLAAKQAARDAAGDALRRVCVMPSETSWPVSAAVEAMCEAGWQGEAERILEDLLLDENAQTEVGAQWVKLCTARTHWKLAERLRDLVERGDIGLRATYAYVEALLRARAAVTLKRFVRNNKDWLRAHTFTWGTAGYGLTGLREYRLAAEWHADWRQRDDAAPWMLVNAVEGLRARGRDREAVEVSRFALSLPPAHGQDLHHLWLATDEAGAGDIAGTRQHLERVDAESLDEDYRFLWTLARSVVEMAQAAPAEARRVFPDVRRRLYDARRKYQAYPAEPARRRAYRRCLAAVASCRGGLRARVWYWLRWLASW
jgi:hypothetical protein